MKTRTAADRLKPYASVTKLAMMPYDERRAVSNDLKMVLQERAAYRLCFWVSLVGLWVAIALLVFVALSVQRHG